MGNLWLRIKIWTKIVLVAVVLIYVLLFTYNNAQHKVEFWYWFHHDEPVNLLLLVLCAFLAGVIGDILVRATFRTVRQVQDLKDRTRVQRMDRDMADIRAKAAMLQTKSSTAEKSAAMQEPTMPPSPIERLEDRQAP
jgi:uncharacterized integral membrane protein